MKRNRPRPLQSDPGLPVRQDRVAAIAHRVNTLPDADPATLAAAIERLILTEILGILADPDAPARSPPGGRR
jgi:hypothetical protein